mmetsp:Transcript_52751/g.115679  ORF Transcript_52751/g.115679 Transcript_52751/m.115679 type:complete len:367 (+) Transcript_52751:374-1474(+)
MAVIVLRMVAFDFVNRVLEALLGLPDLLLTALDLLHQCHSEVVGVLDHPPEGGVRVLPGMVYLPLRPLGELLVLAHHLLGLMLKLLGLLSQRHRRPLPVALRLIGPAPPPVVRSLHLRVPWGAAPAPRGRAARCGSGGGAAEVPLADFAEVLVHLQRLLLQGEVHMEGGSHLGQALVHGLGLVDCIAQHMLGILQRCHFRLQRPVHGVVHDLLPGALVTQLDPLLARVVGPGLVRVGLSQRINVMLQLGHLAVHTVDAVLENPGHFLGGFHFSAKPQLHVCHGHVCLCPCLPVGLAVLILLVVGIVLSELREIQTVLGALRPHAHGLGQPRGEVVSTRPARAVLRGHGHIQLGPGGVVPPVGAGPA